ncbi:MAG: sugar kinase, partial [Deltaproteobacteria bacterium]|nr:sugar kinase [Deltaproteobacteria bacterium]
METQTPPRIASTPLRIAVVGHVEFVTLGRVEATPRAGEIAHLQDPRDFPGGGGGIAFYQMVRGPTEVHLFTAFGGDEAGAWVAAEVARTGASVHAARRAGPHTRDVVMVTPEGERTIVVVGEPLQPRGDDALPWGLLASCDAAYFTAQDPGALRAARAARVLVVSARRREALVRSGVRADVVVGSAFDPREASALEDYPVPPGALVLTEGAAGGRVLTADGATRFEAPPAPGRGGGSYGAGDSFAAALTYYLAAGLGV